MTSKPQCSLMIEGNEKHSSKVCGKHSRRGSRVLSLNHSTTLRLNLLCSYGSAERWHAVLTAPKGNQHYGGVVIFPKLHIVPVQRGCCRNKINKSHTVPSKMTDTLRQFLPFTPSLNKALLPVPKKLMMRFGTTGSGTKLLPWAISPGYL